MVRLCRTKEAPVAVSDVGGLQLPLTLDLVQHFSRIMSHKATPEIEMSEMPSVAMDHTLEPYL